MTLTREEILAMNADRHLDKLIAEVVLGFTLEEGRGLFQKSHMLKLFLSEEEFNKPNLVIKDERYLISGGQREIPRYSNEISAAWEVVEKMNERDEHSLALEFYPNEKEWGADFDEFGVSSQAVSKTAPEAICKAALLAVLNL